MEKGVNKNTLKTFITFLILGLGYAVMIGFIYMQFVYYDPMIKTLGVSNSKLGFLITISAIGAAITSFPGGLICDKYGCAKVLTISLGLSIIFFIWFAISPTYTTALFCWAAVTTTMSGYFPAIYKLVIIIAPEGSSGSSLGLFGASCAISTMFLNFIGLKLYSVFSKTNPTKGFSAVLWLYVFIAIVSMILGYLLIKGSTKNRTNDMDESGRITKHDIICMLKNPGTYLVLLATFSIYSVHVSMSYFTPYFTSVIGTTVVFSGVLAVTRQGLKLVSSPFGGWYGDKIGSNCKVMRFAAVIITILTATVIFLPKATPVAILIIIVMLLALLDGMNLSLEYSTTHESLIPKKYLGTVIGFCSVLSPDLFQETFFGHLLDTYGKRGYNYIFSYTIGMGLVVIIVLTIIIVRFQHKKIEVKPEN